MHLSKTFEILCNMLNGPELSLSTMSIKISKKLSLVSIPEYPWVLWVSVSTKNSTVFEIKYFALKKDVESETSIISKMYLCFIRNDEN